MTTPWPCPQALAPPRRILGDTLRRCFAFASCDGTRVRLDAVLPTFPSSSLRPRHRCRAAANLDVVELAAKRYVHELKAIREPLAWNGCTVVIGVSHCLDTSDVQAGAPIACLVAPSIPTTA